MTTPSPEQQWSEQDYRRAGYRKLGVRVSELAHLRLAEFAEAAGVSRGEVVENLIAAEYERQKERKQ